MSFSTVEIAPQSTCVVDGSELEITCWVCFKNSVSLVNDFFQFWIISLANWCLGFNKVSYIGSEAVAETSYKSDATTSDNGWTTFSSKYSIGRINVVSAFFSASLFSASLFSALLKYSLLELIYKNIIEVIWYF